MPSHYILARWKEPGETDARRSISSSKWRRLPLPVIIANDPRADIIANHPFIANRTVVLYENSGQIQQTWQKEPLETSPSNSPSPAKRDIRALGLEMVGPITGEVPHSFSLRTYLLEALAKERSFYSRFPARLRLMTGARYSQATRLLVWTLILMLVSALTVTLYIADESTPDIPDLSLQAIPLSYDTIVSEVLGATKTRQGYESGITFRPHLPVEDFQSQPSNDFILSFSAAGLNIGKELQLKVSGETLYTSVADPRCITEFCDFYVTIPRKLLAVSDPLLQFIHTPLDSAYAITNIHFRTVLPITDLEQAQAKRWLEIARRAFEERHLLPENILLAKQEAQRTIDYLSQRQGTTSLLAQAKVLQQEASIALDSAIEELQREANMTERLQKFAKTERLLAQLLRLLPNEEDPRHQMLRHKMLEIKEKIQ